MDEAWERAVEAACGGAEPQAVHSIILDGALKCSQGRLPAPTLLERFAQLRVLSIANVGLTSLADFPSLKHLERLILSDNRISGGLEFLVDAGLPSLRDLDLSNNKIQQLDDLAPLAQLNLLSLDLYECPITRVQNYRPKVFSLIKSLQYLDKVDAENNDRPESDEEEDDQEDDEDLVYTADMIFRPGHQDDDDGEESDEDLVYTADRIFSPGHQDDVDGEESDELDEEDDENVQYPAGANQVGQSNEETGREKEVDDEDDTEQVLELQDVEGSGEEAGEDEEDDEDEEEDGTEQASAGVDGEIDAQGEGEEDNSELGDEDEDGDEGVDNDEVDDEDEEEDLGTEYLVHPIARPEDEEGASDFEPGEDDYVDDDDDVDDDEEDAEPAAAALKRKRSKAEDDEEKEERPPKK